MGWKAVEPPVPENKCIILGVPHTSVMDFIISWLYYTSVGGKANVMVKAEFFVWPLGPLMRHLGAVPVDRKHGANIALQMIEKMRKSEKMHLAIAPEGTRKAVARWKTGFHTIARATGVELSFLRRWCNRHLIISSTVQCTGNVVTCRSTAAGILLTFLFQILLIFRTSQIQRFDNKVQ